VCGRAGEGTDEHVTRRILLTNDDGVESPGLAALACGLASHGHDVLVVAPESDRSGASASIGRLTERGPITIRSLVLESGGPPVEARAVDASPGLIALAAVLGGFGPPPDFVLSGANLGPNTGHSILHSGTVGAVLTAQNFGVSGMAVSMDEPDPDPAGTGVAGFGAERGRRWCLDSMCAVAVPVFEWLCEAPRPTALNLNVPAADVGTMGELRWAPLDQFGTVRVSVESTTAGLQFEFREGATDVDPDSDTALLAAGHPTLTSLAGLAVAEPGSGVRRPLQVGARLTSPASTPAGS
jgi:5'-nucleotidase